MNFYLDRLEKPWIWLIANLALWLAVILAFSQGFAVWRWLDAGFGKPVAGLVPLALSLCLAGLAISWCRRAGQLSWRWAIVSVGIFAIGLLATDPDFPAKRIHLPQYFVLTLILYWSCRRHMARSPAIWGAVATAAMLGGLEEVVQGAMPTRTFGLPDIGANALGAVSGGFFLLALAPAGMRVSLEGRFLRYSTVILLGYAMLLFGVHAHKEAVIPVWVYLPGLAALPFAVLESMEAEGRVLLGMAAVCAVAMLAIGGFDASGLDLR